MASRLYPTKTQQTQLEAVLNTCRWLYNSALYERREVYKTWKLRHRHDPNNPLPQVNYYSQSRELTQLKKELGELRQVYDKILRDVLLRVEKTFDAFFRRVKTGQTPGYPRYKSARRYNSFTYPAAAETSEGIDKASGWKLRNNKLTLSMGWEGQEIGPIKIKLHRQAIGKVTQLTISRNNLGEWYACFAMEQIVTLDQIITGSEQVINPVGVSLGIDKLITLSNGQESKNPRWLAQSREKLTKAQQKLSRKLEAKKKSTSNSAVLMSQTSEESVNKAKRRVARIRRHIANQRHDYHHKLSHWLVKTFDGIVLPDLSINQMLQKVATQIDEEKSQEEHQIIYASNGQLVQTNFNRALSEAGWGTLLNYITYKAAEAGKLCVKQDPKDLARTCCRCGWQSCEEANYSTKDFNCGGCGLKISQKWNTALNTVIKRFGANCLGVAALLEQLPPQTIIFDTITELTTPNIAKLLREVDAIALTPVPARASNEPIKGSLGV